MAAKEKYEAMRDCSNCESKDISRAYQAYTVAFNKFTRCLDNGCITGAPATGKDTKPDDNRPDTPTTWKPNDNICEIKLGENCANSPHDCGCGGETCEPSNKFSDARGCVVKGIIGVLYHSEGLESYRNPGAGVSVVNGKEGRIHFSESPGSTAVLREGEPVARVVPQGTEFCIYLDSRSVILQVLKGSASFSDFGYLNTVLVKENHSSVMMLSDQRPSVPVPFDGSKIDKWWEKAIKPDGKNENGKQNQLPVASFAITPANPTTGDTIKGTSTSFDPDGDTLTYSWYFNGEYDSDIGNLPEWTWPNPVAGEHTIKLVAEDGKGGKGEYSMKIAVTGDEEENKSSCFIATAAYGTPMAQEISILREFRDVVLLQNPPGELLVNVYYAISPVPAAFIAKHEMLRTIVREAFLNPTVTILNNTGGFWNGRSAE